MFSSRKRPIFYGWFLLPLCLGNIMIANGVASSFSVIFLSLLSEFGLSRAQLSGIFSLYVFIFFCGGSLIGPLLDRIGPRMIIPLGSVLIGLGLSACSRISSPYQLYFFYGVIASLGACCLSWMPNSIIITNWFVRRRGMAVGIIMCGDGMSILIFIPMTQLMIEWIGWRGTFLAIAIMTVLWVAPLNAIFQRTRPEDKGLSADGDDIGSPESKENRGKTVASTGGPWTLSNAIRHRSFWMMCFATFCNPLASYTIVLHQVVFIVERGFEPMYAASVLGFVGIFAMVGRIASGTLSDTIGREWSYSIFMGSAALAVAFLFFLDQERCWILPLYVVLVGLGTKVGAGMFPPIIADLFSGSSLGRIMGITSAFSGLGASFGSLFAGCLHDITGSYTWGLLCALMAIFAAVTSVWIAAPRRIRKIF